MSQTLSGRAPIEPEAHTAADTLTAEENGTAHSNSGASGAVTLTLPAASTNPGVHYYFAVRAAQELRIDPNGTDTISLPSSGVPGAAGKYLVADAIGETVHLASLGGTNWCVLGYTGTWTAES